MIPDCTIGKRPWKLINVPLAVPNMNALREKFSELTRAEPHLGLNPQAPSLEDPSMTLEAERYALGLKVLTANHAPLSQEFLKKGCPHSLRGKIWAQVLGMVSYKMSTSTNFGHKHFSKKKYVNLIFLM